MSQEPASPPRPSSAAALTVLLVEDDRDLREALTFALGLEGMTVRPYADGEALLAAGPLPEGSVLVLDEKLPGIGGLSLLEALRARGDDLPVVMITTSTTAVRARAEAMDAPIIEKPLLTDELAARLRHMVRGLH